MKRLVYISESNIDEKDAPFVVTQIIADSQLKNAKLAITGALLFTGSYFMQIIEGPRSSVEQLLRSISEDPRHGNIIVIDRSPIIARKFQELKLAYSGPSQFVSRHIMRATHQTTTAERKRSSEWLIELAYQFLVT